MNTNFRKSNAVAVAGESLQQELEQCRRQLENYRKQAELMSGLYANVADGVFVTELDGTIINVNPAACAILGYSKKQLLGMHPWDFVTSATREGILTVIQEMQPGMPVTVQRTYRDKSGDQKFVDLRLNRCELGGRDLIIVSCRDVTEQKRLEKQLRRSEKNLAEGQRLTKTGSWILDFQTGNTDWSVETCRIFGFPDPPPSPHYREFRERVRPEDREAVDRGLRESFETSEPRPLKYVFVLPDGTRKNIETISQPFTDEAGKLKLMGTVMDVTERVKAQEALQKSEDNLQLAIDSIPGLVWSAKPDGHIEYLNQRWTEYTGLTLEQACGWGWRKAIHPDDLERLETYWRSILVEGKSGEIEARLRRFDGEFRWFLFRGFPLYDDLGNLVKWYGTNTDIDDRKSAEEAMRASERLARGQVEVLKKTLDSLTTESDPDRLVGHILSAITEQFGAHSSSVWRRDEASNMIGFEFAFENGKVVPKTDARFAGMDLCLPMEDFWPWPEVFRTGKPSLIEDIRTVPPFALRDRLLPWGIVTVLLVPVFVTGHLEGAIGLRFTRKRTFRAEEIELAQALANQATLAMQLANLYAQSRESAVIAERNRMARDIHDALAQGFTGVIMQLEAAADATSKGLPQEAHAHLGRASQLARESLREARRSVRALRPMALEKKDLCEALKELLKKMTDGTSLRTKFSVRGEPRSLPVEWEENLLRIGQEVLTNALRHARATEFKSQLEFKPKEVCLELKDNGTGFDPSQKSDGFGLLGISERVESMGGKLTIESASGKGTMIFIALPGGVITQSAPI